MIYPQTRLLATGTPQIAAVILCVTVNACIAATLATAIPVILTAQLGASYIQASVLLVSGALSSAVVAHYIGRLSDSGTSRRALAVIAAIAGGVGFLFMAQTESYLGFLVIFLTLIAIANSLFPQFMALAFVLAPKSVPMARAFASFGWVLGPPIAGFAIATLGYGVTFKAIAILYMVLICIVMLCVSGNQARNVEGPTADTQSHDYASKAAGSDRSAYLDIVVILSVIHLLMALPLISIPLRMIELGGTEFQVGLAFGVAALIEIPIIAMAGQLRERISPKNVFAGSAAALCLYFLLLAIATTPTAIIGANILNGIVTGVMMGYGLIVLQERLPTRPGHASALYSNVLRLTHIGALVLAGAVAQLLSFPVLFSIAAGLAGVVALAFVVRPIGIKETDHVQG